MVDLEGLRKMVTYYPLSLTLRRVDFFTAFQNDILFRRY